MSSPTSMKKLKDSFELPYPTRNTRKFANKLMTDTSGEKNLQRFSRLGALLTSTPEANSTAVKRRKLLGFRDSPLHNKASR